jgi:outer membrane protein OmpA-like peptidoglycan-associated protein
MKYKSITAIMVILFLFIETGLLLSEDVKDYRVGLSAGLNIISHESNIPIIWGENECGLYDKGNSLGYQGAVVFTYSLTDFLKADIRLVYRSVPITLTSTTSDFEVYNPQTLNYSALYIEHEFNSKLNYLTFEPAFLIQPYSQLPLHLRLGFDAGNPLFGNSYETTDKIISPKVYTFPDQTQKHTTQSGSLNAAGTSYGAIAGIIYDYKLNEDIYLQGEINYRYPLNSSISGTQLESSWIGINAGIQYAFNFEKELPPKKEPDLIPPVDAEIPEPIIAQDTVIIAEINDDIEILPAQLEMLETIVTQTYPILPYIFFDSLSYDLKQIYRRQAGDGFAESKLPTETLEIYYSMLDIIGSRLRDNVGSEITITGMSDGREGISAEERLVLAGKRASTVADYLTEQWKIDKKRIKIDVRELPEIATSTIYEEGYQENRRVEIISNDYNILKPVVFSKFSEYEAVTEILPVTINTNQPEKYSDIEINIKSGEKLISSAQSDYSVLKLNLKLDENQRDALASLYDGRQTPYLEYKYSLGGIIKSGRTKLAILNRENKFELGRLNLIVFDFDRSDINQQNKNLIKNFIANTIADNSIVTITGSTDRLGERDYNMNLSKSRAESTYNFIKSIKPKANFKSVEGIGDSKLKYDNGLPEGRFYCRTVLIEVITPINK